MWSCSRHGNISTDATLGWATGTWQSFTVQRQESHKAGNPIDKFSHSDKVEGGLLVLQTGRKALRHARLLQGLPRHCRRGAVARQACRRYTNCQ